MTSHIPKIEVLSGPEPRRRWSTAEKLAIVQETYEPDVTVSIVARRHGIQPNQLFSWRNLAAQGALTATASQEEVVPASGYRALQNQVKELQRMILATNDLYSYCISLSGSVEVFGVSGIFLLGGGAIDELVPSAALLLR